jgi:hypothetical protein
MEWATFHIQPTVAIRSIGDHSPTPGLVRVVADSPGEVGEAGFLEEAVDFADEGSLDW